MQIWYKKVDIGSKYYSGRKWQSQHLKHLAFKRENNKIRTENGSYMGNLTSIDNFHIPSFRATATTANMLFADGDNYFVAKYCTLKNLSYWLVCFFGNN